LEKGSRERHTGTLVVLADAYDFVDLVFFKGTTDNDKVLLKVTVSKTKSREDKDTTRKRGNLASSSKG